MGGQNRALSTCIVSSVLFAIYTLEEPNLAAGRIWLGRISRYSISTNLVANPTLVTAKELLSHSRYSLPEGVSS
jgi:hypothetical protein